MCSFLYIHVPSFQWLSSPSQSSWVTVRAVSSIPGTSHSFHPDLESVPDSGMAFSHSLLFLSFKRGFIMQSMTFKRQGIHIQTHAPPCLVFRHSTSTTNALMVLPGFSFSPNHSNTQVFKQNINITELLCTYYTKSSMGEIYWLGFAQLLVATPFPNGERKGEKNSDSDFKANQLQGKSQCLTDFDKKKDLSFAITISVSKQTSLQQVPTLSH